MTRRKRSVLWVLALLCMPAATIAQSPPATPSGVWPGFRGGPARDGVGTDGPKGHPVLRWRYQAQGAANADIAVGGGLAFTSTDDGVLHAIDVATGVERWSLAADHAPFGGPLFAGDTLYVFDGIGVAHAYDPATGTERWHGAASVGIPSNIEVADGALFVGTDTGLDAIDAATGAMKWTYTPPAGGGVHSPAIADGIVYASTDKAGYIAVDEATGTLLWTHDTGDDLVGTAVISDGVAFLGSTDDPPGRLTALDAKTGALLWSDDEQLQSPAVAGGVAVSAGPIGVVVGHEVRTGKELWRTPISDKTRTAIIADGVAYIAADTQHRVYALDLGSGTELWHFDVDGGLDCCVSVADGAVFAGTGLGGIYAIGGSDNPAAVPSTGPIASPATSPAVTSKDSASPVPSSVSPSPIAGIPDGKYTTGPLKAGEIRAAITAAGYDPAALGDLTDSVYTLQFDSGRLRIYIGEPGQPASVGWDGRFSFVDADTFEAHDAISHITYDYTLDGDVLTIHMVSDSLQDAGELAAQSGVYDTAPFTRVVPVSSSPSPVAGIPDGRWMTDPIAVADVIKLIDDAGYDGAGEVDGFGATGASTIRFTLDIDSSFLRPGDIVDDRPFTPMAGAYVLTYPKPGVFRIRDNVSTSDIAYQLDGDRLTARFLADTDTNQDPGELGAATGILNSGIFVLQP